MGFGVSIFLIATGAILRYGVNRSTWEAVDLNAVGMIAMVVGVIGLAVSTIIWAPWSERRRGTIVDDTVTEPHSHVSRH